MKVLVVGSGGREHALCWALSASALVDSLYCAPGNGGIADVATCIDIAPIDFAKLTSFCHDEGIDFVVIGPEGPLVAGAVDHLEAAGIKTFGPSQAASALEGSKAFTKELCTKYDIPTAAYGRFSEPDAARAFVAKKGVPIVVKADGLAAGKGVVIAESVDQANAAIADILGGRFGEAGNEIIIEEFLEGEEASFFALVDGHTALPMVSAQDHKAVGDGDTGPNTGGMGAYSPAPVMTKTLHDEVMGRIIQPTVAAMAAEGCPYKGVLYAGLMIDEQGPKLLEYNIRFGDPECQVLMPRLKSDLLPALMAARDGALDQLDLRWNDRTALCVIMASRGYPGDYESGSSIGGLDRLAELDDVIAFHAGTKRDGDSIVANGGRVLGITALGDDVKSAQLSAYRAIDRIEWPEGFYRGDIGWRAILREKQKA